MNNTVNLTSGLNIIEFKGESLNLSSKDINCDVFISIKDGNNKALNLDVRNSSCNLFIFNEFTQKINLTENYNLYENANATLNFVDVFSNDLTRVVATNLLEKRTNCSLNCAILGFGDKKITIDATNSAGESSVNMDNSSVILKDASFELVASGIIKKGAKESKNFQKNHALTLGKNKKVKIVPNLLIDENDVEAGHGCTIGDVDENTMYYLNTRGLSNSDAMALIVDSFLKTIANNIYDENIKSDVKAKIERQVEIYAN